MTFSLAMRPTTAATANTHPFSSCNPKPSGVNSQVTKEPMSCRILSSMPTICHFQEKFCRNHSTMQEARMMVNAFLI